MSVERVEVEALGSPWKEEHLSRYSFIRDRVRGKVVLDIACGTGFGSQLLLENGASHVFAADVAEEAITMCSSRLGQLGRSNWTCHYQDGTAMDYEDNKFDMVVSFETIEHIPDYKKFLSEICRVLKPGGHLVISTPNALVTNPSKGKPENPFHVYEFDPAELQELLQQHFEIELSAGQHVKPSYGVAPYLPSFRKDKLGLKGLINFRYWQVMLRAPKTVADTAHNIFYGSDFYPSVGEYTFNAADLNMAHVQYHICRKK
ncbi:MAG: class I SAM-dependent methyltransferase [Chitinophagaceae bacterium]|nr:MAG: class I SAM-dependent methyltransferase [Chitinophagaceae bacterium]